MFRLDGKVALVSGAGRGMGFGVAQTLARQGATVVINDFFGDRAEAGAQALRDEGLQAFAATADMTDRFEIEIEVVNGGEFAESLGQLLALNDRRHGHVFS